MDASDWIPSGIFPGQWCEDVHHRGPCGEDEVRSRLQRGGGREEPREMLEDDDFVARISRVEQIGDVSFRCFD